MSVYNHVTTMPFSKLQFVTCITQNVTYLFLKLTYTVSRKKKSLKNAKKTQNMVNFFIVNVQKKHENFFYFNDNSFSFFLRYQLHPCVQRCAWQNVQNVFLIEHAI